MVRGQEHPFPSQPSGNCGGLSGEEVESVLFEHIPIDLGMDGRLFSRILPLYLRVDY